MHPHTHTHTHTHWLQTCTWIAFQKFNEGMKEVMDENKPYFITGNLPLITPGSRVWHTGGSHDSHVIRSVSQLVVYLFVYLSLNWVSESPHSISPLTASFPPHILSLLVFLSPLNSSHSTPFVPVITNWVSEPPLLVVINLQSCVYYHEQVIDISAYRVCQSNGPSVSFLSPCCILLYFSVVL